MFKKLKSRDRDRRRSKPSPRIPPMSPQGLGTTSFEEPPSHSPSPTPEHPETNSYASTLPALASAVSAPGPGRSPKTSPATGPISKAVQHDEKSAEPALSLQRAVSAREAPAAFSYVENEKTLIYNPLEMQRFGLKSMWQSGSNQMKIRHESATHQGYKTELIPLFSRSIDSIASLRAVFSTSVTCNKVDFKDNTSAPTCVEWVLRVNTLGRSGTLSSSHCDAIGVVVNIGDQQVKSLSPNSAKLANIANSANTGSTANIANIVNIDGIGRFGKKFYERSDENKNLVFFGMRLSDGQIRSNLDPYWREHGSYKNISFSSNDFISVRVNLQAQTIAFAKNSQDLGVAFDKIYDRVGACAAASGTGGTDTECLRRQKTLLAVAVNSKFNSYSFERVCIKFGGAQIIQFIDEKAVFGQVGNLLEQSQRVLASMQEKLGKSDRGKNELQNVLNRVRSYQDWIDRIAKQAFSLRTQCDETEAVILGKIDLKQSDGTEAKDGENVVNTALGN